MKEFGWGKKGERGQFRIKRRLEMEGTGGKLKKVGREVGGMDSRVLGTKSS